jgi:hypothetical protein
MARATRLRIYSETPDEGDGGDQRTVERFPAPPPPVPPNSQLGEDVLTLLRRDTQQAIAQADHADATASNALLHAQQASSTVATLTNATETLAARTSQVEASTQEIAQRAMAAIEAVSQRRAGLAAGAATAAQQALALFIQILAFVLERTPALLALAAAVWLWAQVLEDPSILRLVGLGMFGLLVMAPVLWLSARKGGGGAG